MAETMLMAPRPSHVPEALTYDFDLSNDPLLRPDLHRGLIEPPPRTPEIIPITIFMEMMGVPLELRLPLRKLNSAALFAGHPDERDVKFAEMERMLQGLADARFERRDHNIISRMIDSDFDGRRPTVEEMLRNWPVFRLDPDNPPTESAGIVYSVDRLSLVWKA